MTPKIVVILDKETRKTDIFRYDDGPLPPLVNPARPGEAKDGGVLKDEPAPAVIHPGGEDEHKPS